MPIINFPKHPEAQTLADLITPRQLVAIRAISNSQGIDFEEACKGLMNCEVYAISRRAASCFIDWLKTR